MNPEKVVNVLQMTMDPQRGKEAEETLKQMQKIVKFSPLLMKIVMSTEVDSPVRQCGAVYLKNFVEKYYEDQTDDNGCPDTERFSIHEDDKTVLRENIVEAIVMAPHNNVRNQLTVVANTIIKHSFPEKWPNLIEKIQQYLSGGDVNQWMGALLVLYQIVKVFEYKKPESRKPVNETMKHLMPGLLQMFSKLLQDDSNPSLLMQKQLVKIFYSFMQYHMVYSIFNDQTTHQFVTILNGVLEKPVPEHTNQVDESERSELPCWKLKKWVMRLSCRIFERYGCPNSHKEKGAAKKFASNFMKKYACQLMQTIMKYLSMFRSKTYVSQRVLQLAFQYLEQGVSQSHTWKILQPAFMEVLSDVVFPLMCFTEEDQLTWEDDPQEYIRKKFSIFEDFLSPANAAHCFLTAVCTKRKNMLTKTMHFCNTVLTVGNNSEDFPRKKDGILHMIGTLGESLLKRKMYKDQLELMINTHVAPELKSPLPYMRARACWTVKQFCEVKFKHPASVTTICDGLKLLLLRDNELPVRVEAASAMSAVLQDQPIAEKHWQVDVKEIVQALLELVRSTESDELTNVVQKVICAYSEDIAPFAVDITQNLAQTFMQLAQSIREEQEGGLPSNEDDYGDDKSSTAMGILSAIETVVEMSEESEEITAKLEEVVLPVIDDIIRHRQMDYYDELFSLTFSLTCQKVSANMWKVLPLIYEIFQEDAIDFFVEMTPCLHNYVVVDTPALLQQEKNFEIIFLMCKKVLQNEVGEDPEAHALKLLEVLVLQCKGKIDQVIPHILEAMFERFGREQKTQAVRTMCIQLGIAALYYSPQLTLQTMQTLEQKWKASVATDCFFTPWFQDINKFAGIHERKMCVVGMCTLMSLQNRPQIFDNMTSNVVPALINVFNGLIRAYKLKGEEEASDSEDESEEEEEDEMVEKQELSSDEDEIEENEFAQYADNEDATSSFYDEETDLEATFSTYLDADHFDEDKIPADFLDEFVFFKSVVRCLENENSALYSALISGLNEKQVESLKEIYLFADQRKAAQESKKIENSGGYKFEDKKEVPTSFNFAGNSSPFGK